MGFRRGMSEVPHGVPMIVSTSMMAFREGDTTAMTADGQPAAHQWQRPGCSACTVFDVEGHSRWLEIDLIRICYQSRQTIFLEFKASEQTCTVPTACSAIESGATSQVRPDRPNSHRTPGGILPIRVHEPDSRRRSCRTRFTAPRQTGPDPRLQDLVRRALLLRLRHRAGVELRG